MEERIKFIVGQKKRILNEISSRVSEFKLEGKNFGLFVTIKKDGSLALPKGFVCEDLPILSMNYSSLTKKEKKIYDAQYVQSTQYLIKNYNEANEKYNACFEQLDVFDKIDLLKEEINTLSFEQKRAKIYLSTLLNHTSERIQNKLNSDKKFTDEQLLEINEEITQIKYIEKFIQVKTEQMESLKETL